jgi:hypothetical protein
MRRRLCRIAASLGMQQGWHSSARRKGHPVSNPAWRRGVALSLPADLVTAA